MYFLQLVSELSVEDLGEPVYAWEMLGVVENACNGLTPTVAFGFVADGAPQGFGWLYIIVDEDLKALTSRGVAVENLFGIFLCSSDDGVAIILQADRSLGRDDSICGGEAKASRSRIGNAKMNRRRNSRAVMGRAGLLIKCMCAKCHGACSCDVSVMK
eukprot:Gb_11170 [translate_table: standard]